MKLLKTITGVLINPASAIKFEPSPRGGYRVTMIDGSVVFVAAEEFDALQAPLRTSTEKVAS